MSQAIPLIDLYQQHYAPARLLTATAHTKARFEIEIKRLAEFLGRKPTTADFQTNTLSALLSDMIGKGLAMETVAGTRKKLVALWRFASQKRFVDEWPDVPSIPEERDPPIAWTEDEILRLFKACREQKGTVCGVPAHLWWHSLHMVLMDTGTRIGATLQVKWAAVNIERGTMLFKASTQKNKRGQIHKLRPETVAELAIIREPARELVWPWGRHKTSLYYAYEKILEQAGLPISRDSKFHKLRKTVATWFESKGGNATELLGHASRKHTKDSYLDETQIERPSPASLLPAMNRPITDRQQPGTELERLLSAFLESEKVTDRRGGMVSPQSRQAVKNSVNRFLRLMPAAKLDDLTPEAVGALCRRMDGKLSPATVIKYRSDFRRFLRWLVSQGHESAQSAIEAIAPDDDGQSGKDDAV